MKVKDGIDFQNLSEIKQLLNGVSPGVQALMDARMKLYKAYLAAEEDMIVAFCARNGIDLITDVQGARRRQAMMKHVELVCATVQPAPEEPGKDRIIQESWCVDRRGGKTGYERTYPYVQLIAKGDSLSFEVVTVDLKEEQTNGTDGRGQPGPAQE